MQISMGRVHDFNNYFHKMVAPLSRNSSFIFYFFPSAFWKMGIEVPRDTVSRAAFKQKKLQFPKEISYYSWKPKPATRSLPRNLYNDYCTLLNCIH